MSLGPYRAPVRMPLFCGLHEHETSFDTCARCGLTTCVACSSFDGSGVRCAACARRARVGRGLVRAVAATLLAIVCALPALAVPVPGRGEPLRDMSARLAIRWCNQEELLVAMLGMYGSDRYERLVAFGDAYFATCEGPPSRNVEHMMDLARERLPR